MRTEEDRVSFREAVRQHHYMHTTERALYESRIKTAANNPNEICSIVADCPIGYEIPHVRPGLIIIFVHDLFFNLIYRNQRFLSRTKV